MDKIAQLEQEKDNSKECKVEIICNSEVYAKKTDSGHILNFYYFISWNSYLKEENTWELALTIYYFYRLVTSFYHDYLKKLIITLSPIDFALLMARPIVKSRVKILNIKQKDDQPAKSNDANKWTKKT